MHHFFVRWEKKFIRRSISPAIQTLMYHPGGSGRDLYLMGKLAPRVHANHGGGAARAKLEQRHSPPARFHPRQVELSLFQSFSIFIFQENPLLTNRSIIILLSPTAVPGEICTSVGGKGGTGTPKGLNTRAKDSHPGRRFSRNTSSTHRRGNGQ